VEKLTCLFKVVLIQVCKKHPSCASYSLSICSPTIFGAEKNSLLSSLVIAWPNLAAFTALSPLLDHHNLTTVNSKHHWPSPCSEHPILTSNPHLSSLTAIDCPLVFLPGSDPNLLRGMISFVRTLSHWLEISLGLHLTMTTLLPPLTISHGFVILLLKWVYKRKKNEQLSYLNLFLESLRVRC